MRQDPRVDEPVRVVGSAETLAAVDARLAEVCDDIAAGWAARHDEPVDVLREDLPAQLRTRLLGAAGKRLRPVMCHWGWVAAGGAAGRHGWEDMVAAASALDLLHLFALVHDDIMDRSATRRGLPTVHVLGREDHEAAEGYGEAELFGDSVALLLGDLALSEAGHLVGDTPLPVRVVWREMLRELVHGQLLDLAGTAARRRDIGLARRVARLKSGAYTISRPLILGAVAAGAGPAALTALTSYGDHLGEAFALRDDLLGIWGDAAATGKPVGDDLLAGKATVVLALARQLLPPEENERFLGAGRTLTAADVGRLQALLVECGVRSEVEARIGAEADAAATALSGAGLDPDGVVGLRTMIAAVAWREA
ncbi:MAG TPA: polyprenyl synthetase family protein [Dermatophilaceae bacterium]|nr:polyprenyl synthetase family protein [Dermatophilaceae bacterium]